MNDLRVDLIDKARIMATNRTVNHPWYKMTDLEMLRSASLYEKNLQTGEEGFNLACILLFGKDDVIASALSYIFYSFRICWLVFIFYSHTKLESSVC